MQTKKETPEATQSQSNTDDRQKNSSEFVLVDGQFTASEARKVLTNLLRSKISYHKNKKLRSLELPGTTNSSSEDRIEELEHMRQQLLEKINKAEKSGQSMKIHSKIEIELESSD